MKKVVFFNDHTDFRKATLNTLSSNESPFSPDIVVAEMSGTWK